MRNISTYTLLCSVISSASALAANTGESFSHAEQQKIDAQQQQLQQTQEQVRQATFADHREVRVETPVEKSISFPKEEKCFPIKELYLTELHSEHPAAIEQLTEDDLKTDFDWALKAVYAPKDFQLPYCVG
jgi:hemolysin activation/secretion protein